MVAVPRSHRDDGPRRFERESVRSASTRKRVVCAAGNSAPADPAAPRDARRAPALHRARDAAPQTHRCRVCGPRQRSTDRFVLLNIIFVFLAFKSRHFFWRGSSSFSSPRQGCARTAHRQAMADEFEPGMLARGQHGFSDFSRGLLSGCCRCCLTSGVDKSMRRANGGAAGVAIGRGQRGRGWRRQPRICAVRCRRHCAGCLILARASSACMSHPTCLLTHPARPAAVTHRAPSIGSKRRTDCSRCWAW